MPEKPAPNFNRDPMLWLAVCFALGILLARSGPFDQTLVLIILAAAFAALALSLRKYELSTGFIGIAFIVAGVVSLQYENSGNNSPGRLKVLYDSGAIRSGDPVEVEGVLLGRPEASIDGVFLNMRSDKITYRGSELPVSGNVRLFLPAAYKQDKSEEEPDEGGDDNLKFEISDLKYGSRVRAACKLKREDEFLNPGVVQKREILDRLDIDATGSIKSRLLVEKLADESVFMPLAWVYDERARLIDDLKSTLNRTTAGVMIASLLGDKNFLDKDTADLFREGGTFHILVISGLHITFIGGLLLLFLRQLTRNRWIQFIVTTLSLWAYTLAVGAHVPVVRASLMFTIVLFSYAIYRVGSLLNSLGVCGLILLVWRPSDLFDPSFQLTFISVMAIVAIAYPLVDSLQKIGRWTPSARTPFPPDVPQWLKRSCEMLYWNADAWKIQSKQQIWTANLFKSPFLSKRMLGSIRTPIRYVFEGILVSLIVQICMLPLMVVYFHRISAASVLLNIWVGFFIAFESFAAVGSAILSHFSLLLASPFVWSAGAINSLMLSLPRLFADNGWASFRLPAYSGAGRAIYVLYFLPVLLFVFAVNRWTPFELKQSLWPIKKNLLFPAFAVLLALTGIVAFHPFSAPRPDGRLHFDFLDVGQGDSALVTFPDGKTLLVDGGGRVSQGGRGDDDDEPFEPDVRGIGEAVVSEFLWYRGYSAINYILATHADADHIQGLDDVAKNFSIGSAEFGRTPMKNHNFADLSEILHHRGIPAETISRGDRLEYGGATVEVLYPIATDDPDAVSDNDHCIVLRITYGNRAFLLTGDIERTAEAALINGGGMLAADLIKVPHHGSRTSSTQGFIDAIGPKYAIISVGRSSRFGHPHPEVVERWRNSGVEVITTGERGTISVSTDGKDLLVDRFLPEN